MKFIDDASTNTEALASVSQLEATYAIAQIVLQVERQQGEP